MKLIYKNILLLLVAITTSIALNSCHEKGCTNPNAINYNVTADKDDGSCILCNPTQTSIGSATVNIIDNNSSSQFFEQTVAQLHFDQELFAFSSSQCGVSSSTISLKITNLVNKQMTLDFDVFSSGPVEVEFDRDVFISANQTSDQGIISTLTSPPFTSINFDSFSVDVFSISYN